MTDLIALAGVEEKYMVRIGHRLIAADVPHVNAPIGEHEMRGRGAFLCAAMTARAAAADVSQRYGIRGQQMVAFELGQVGHTHPNILSLESRHRLVAKARHDRRDALVAVTALLIARDSTLAEEFAGARGAHRRAEMKALCLRRHICRG